MKEIKCKICGKYFVHNQGLSSHIKRIHKIEQEKYYNLYLQKDKEENICEVCGNKNKFIDIVHGYTVGCCREHSNIILYGVDNPWKNKDIIAKMVIDKREKYGTPNNQKKQKETIKALYGEDVDNISKIPEVKRKIEETNMQNLGVRMPFQSKEIQKKCAVHGKSKKEKELLNNIKEKYCGTINENDRVALDGLELDMYFPERNLAIEYNSVYYHSDIFLDKFYHLNKSIKCRDKNIRLIHIWDNENIIEQLNLFFELLLNNNDMYPKDDFNKNNLLGEIPKEPNIIFKSKNFITYGAGKISKEELQHA